MLHYDVSFIKLLKRPSITIGGCLQQNIFSKEVSPEAFATARMPLTRRSALAPGKIDLARLTPVACPGGVNVPCCGLGSRPADFILREAALSIAVFVVNLS